MISQQEVKTTHRIDYNTYARKLEKLNQEVSVCQENQQAISSFLKHLELGKSIGRKKRRSIKYLTLYKYLPILVRIAKALRKPFSAVTQADIDAFRMNLRQDTSISNATKLDIEYKVLRMLFIWLGKPELVDYFNEYQQRKEIPALRREQVERMTAPLKLRDKLIIWLLFDGGFRAQELLNITFADVKSEDRNKGYYKIRIRESKTLPRTVSVPLCTDLLNNWLALHPEKIQTSEYLMPLTYNLLRKLIKKVAIKYLAASWVTPHTLRHSSATFYCKKLGQYDLCKRYGWSMSSDMPKCYIDREGVDDGGVGEAVINEQAAQVSEENKRLKEEIAILKDQMTNITELISRAIITPKSDIEAALERKKQQAT